MIIADYWISFRVEHDSEAGWQRRYDALQKAIQDCATNGFWDANTPFLAIGSSYRIAVMGRHLKKGA
jgi:hypothetical protein